MLLSVNTPMKGKDITELLEAYNENGVSFKFLKKTGLRHDFEVNGIDKDEAISLVKKIIRATPYGSALYFSVTAE